MEIDDSQPRILDELADRYPLRMIALTRGDAGSRLYVRGKVFDHPGCRTEVVDSIGAGDAFTAALAMGLLRGDDPATINERANRLASFVCSQPGATPKPPAELLRWNT